MGGTDLKINNLSKSKIQELLLKSKNDSQFKCNLECPIDCEHVIDVGMLDSHINNCRRRNAHIGQLKCPYNEYHYCRNKIELDGHVKSCPDYSPSKGKTPADQREVATIQIVELKLQCGLPVNEEEMATFLKHNSKK